MNFQLNVGWLYPDLMSTYGDRGNIICLTKRCQWRNIAVKIQPIEVNTEKNAVESCDLFLGGGSQDRQQEIVITDLQKKKPLLIKLFDKGTPGLFVCGSPQLLGHYYMTGDGKRLEGLGIFDFVTRHFGHDKPRCIGNTVGEVIGINIASHSGEERSDDSRIRKGFWTSQNDKMQTTIVGFENHGGRTYLGKNCQPFAKVIIGYGNNGEDGYEGAVYKNVIACYYHGPFLSKNPHIADWLITQALEVKYGSKIQLEPLDDSLEWQAHEFMLNKLKVHKVKSL